MTGQFGEDVFTDEFAPIEVLDTTEIISYTRVESLIHAQPTSFSELEYTPTGSPDDTMLYDARENNYETN